MKKPPLVSYDFNALVCIWKMSSDEFTRNKIKMAIIDKILLSNSSIFYLMNKFISTKTVLLKECYADAILMKMKGEDYYFNDDFVSELLTHASLDGLVYYGTETLSYEFNNKCMEEFWRRAIEIENKIELNNKQNLDKQNLDKQLVLSLKKKGDKNDKY